MITPILRKPNTDAEPAEDNAEARMRQALGKLGTANPGRPEGPRRATPYQAAPGAGRHRFRQDGEVPVVRISLTDGGRSAERHSHAPAGSVSTRHGQASGGREQGSSDSTRQVQELTEQLRATQTRLGHAELALQEAGREARARQEEAAALRHALEAAEATLAQAREALHRSRHAMLQLHPGPESQKREAKGSHHRVGRPFGSTYPVRDQVSGNEPEPVKWWAGD